MTEIAAIRSLREQVEAGDFGDTGVDRFSAIPKRGGGVYADPNWYDAHEAYWRGSLEAAKNLHEALLPDEGWHVEYACKYPGLSFKPACFCASVGWGTRYSAYAETPGRAWLIAILYALEAQPNKAA
jgi:hypothetical protein